MDIIREQRSFPKFIRVGAFAVLVLFLASVGIGFMATITRPPSGEYESRLYGEDAIADTKVIRFEDGHTGYCVFFTRTDRDPECWGVDRGY